MEEITTLLQRASELKRLGSLKHHPEYPNLVKITNFLPNDASVARRLWHVNNSTYEIPTCEMCDLSVSWRKENGGKYSTYCSSACSYKDSKVIEKRGDTNLRRYGSSTPLGNKEIHNKTKQTWLQQHGVDNPSKIPSVRKKKSKQAILQKNKHLTEIDTINTLIESGYTQQQIGNKLGITQPRVSSLFQTLGVSTIQTTSVSSIENELLEFLSSLNVTAVSQCRNIIPPYEIDIFIPDRNIGIEINGCYWHSELKGRGRKYHITKTQMCEHQHIRLIQIIDTEWKQSPNIVKSRLKAFFQTVSSRVFARQCAIEKITSAVCDQFIEEHHIQGIRSAKHNYGLFYNSTLIAVMSFSSHQLYEYEMIRFCNKTDYIVVGGASKLFAAFVGDIKPSSVITYADRRWGTGDSYSHLGFVHDGYTQPNYWYFKQNNATKLYSRQKFQKHKLPKILEHFDPSKTEWENMVEHGYDRIWDCGSSRWIWTSPYPSS